MAAGAGQVRVELQDADWEPKVGFNEGLRKTLDWYEAESAVHTLYEAVE